MLGPLQIQVAAVDAVVNGDRKHRLLARLALTPSRDVSVDSLISAMWGDHAPRTAKQSVHVHISHIREKLRPLEADQLITTTASGAYRLGIDRDDIDASRFESLIDAGLLAYRSNNARHARDVLRDAVELWAEPYPSLADHPGAIAERQRLTALHESAIDALCAALLELDEQTSAVPLLRQVLAHDPLRERPYAQLVSAYMAIGELGAAQGVLKHAEQVFHDALGIAPSNELQSLLHGIEDRRPNTGTRAPTSVEFTVGNGERIDVARSLFMRVDPGADLRGLEDEVSALAGGQERRVAWGRVSTTNQGAPWSPLAELADLEFELLQPAAAESARSIHRRLTDALVAQFSAGFVLVVEGIEHADAALVDYLTLELAKPGPSPFTLLAITRSREVASHLGHLVSAVDETLDIELAPHELAGEAELVIDDNERSVLAAMVCAMLPTTPALVARTVSDGVAAGAAAIDRLITRGIVLVEPGSKLGLRNLERVGQTLRLDEDEQSGLHLEMADLVSSSEADDGYRIVAEGRHRLLALPSGSLSTALHAALLASRHLKAIGAYQAVVELLSGTSVPVGEWPNTANSLELRTILGWAQMRAGQTDDGFATLEDVVVAARELDRPDLFAEAVRGLAEQRSPQSSSDQVRDLVADALHQLGDVVTDTRVQLMTDYANSFYLTDPDKAERLAGEALAIGRSGDSATTARALTGYVQAKLRPGNAAERLELALEAQQHARRSNLTESLVLALTYEASALIEMGELRRASPPLRYAEALAFDSRVPRFQWWVAAWFALLDFATGNLTDAEDRFRATFELWPTSARNDAFECFAAQLCALRLVQGRGAELLPIMESMLEGNDLSYLAPASVAQAQAGKFDDAAVTLDRLMGPGGIGECRDIRLPYLLAMAAETAHLIDARHWGSALTELIAPIADVHVTLNVWGGGGYYWGLLRHAHGLALHLSGETETAVQTLVQAASEQTAAGATVFAARSQALAEQLR